MCELLDIFEFVGKVNVQPAKAFTIIKVWTTGIATSNKNQLNLQIKRNVLRDTSDCIFAIETLLKDT